MPSLPTGTVTFLFTDIEGSTALLQRLGDRQYAEVLAEHQRLLRDAFAKGNGQEIDTQGDAFLVAFSRARDAVAAAVAAQQALMTYTWPDSASLQVRMGLHTGEPISGGTGYVGIDVHRASRIAAAGHGGQVLVSDATYGLVSKDLPKGVRLRDLGEHRLKDLAHPHRLFQVVVADLPADFPPLKSLDARPNNLPSQLTSFIGREREKAEVRRLLSSARLLTLTGSGGAGKTRLALQVAAEGLEEFRDGAWLVELAVLSDPRLVPKAVASALDVPEQPGRMLTETLVGSLRGKSALVILDNCEHLVAACADLTTALLRACPNVRVLATSREALGVTGETIWRVPSLSVPDPERLPPLDRFTDSEAVRLFIDRAVANAPQFAVTSGNAPAVAQVCHRLDGIPLAIELAAARIKVLAVEQIASRLDDRFRLLTGGSRTALPHQQTLRAAMDWSYELLSPKEQVVQCRLSVFFGGCTLDGAEAVAAGDTIAAAEILDLVTQLVDKSMVVADIEAGAARYRLLETIRQYGWEKLAESGDEAATRGRHLDWFLALAREASPHLTGPTVKVWLARLEREHDNFRAALEWSMADGKAPNLGLALAVALAGFWEVHSHFTEGRRWLEAALARCEAPPPALRADALNAAGILAYRQGDYERTSALCSEALAASEAHGYGRGAGRSLHFLAHLRQVRGDYAGATQMMERSIARHREAGEPADLANSVDCLGEIARNSGDYGRAGALGEKALALYRHLGHLRGQAHLLHNLAYVRLHQAQTEEARALFRDSLALAQELGDVRDAVFALAGLACASVDYGESAGVTRMFGAVEALLSAIEIHLEPAEEADVQRHVEAARSRLAPEAFAAAWAEGRAMTLEQAIEYALQSEG